MRKRSQEMKKRLTKLLLKQGSYLSEALKRCEFKSRYRWNNGNDDYPPCRRHPSRDGGLGTTWSWWIRRVKCPEVPVQESYPALLPGNWWRQVRVSTPEGFSTLRNQRKMNLKAFKRKYLSSKKLKPSSNSNRISHFKYNMVMLENLFHIVFYPRKFLVY